MKGVIKSFLSFILDIRLLLIRRVCQHIRVHASIVLAHCVSSSHMPKWAALGYYNGLN